VVIVFLPFDLLHDLFGIIGEQVAQHQECWQVGQVPQHHDPALEAAKGELRPDAPARN